MSIGTASVDKQSWNSIVELGAELPLKLVILGLLVPWPRSVGILEVVVEVLDTHSSHEQDAAPLKVCEGQSPEVQALREVLVHTYCPGIARIYRELDSQLAVSFGIEPAGSRVSGVGYATIIDIRRSQGVNKLRVEEEPNRPFDTGDLPADVPD